jgi:predicted ATP-binding protein involved in virulence
LKTSKSAGKDLTILVGENNGGKSNTIDALRLITTPLSGRREIYCESSDIRFGGAELKFEVQATFSDLSVPQQRRLISAVTDHTLEKVTFGLTYDETQKTSSCPSDKLGRPSEVRARTRMPRHDPARVFATSSRRQACSRLR